MAMKRKTAIALLNNLRAFAEDDDEPAIDVAIEALEYIEKHKDILDLVNVFAELGFDTNKIIWSAQEWIPCSERLPEENVPVNVTWVNRVPEPYYADIKDKPFTATGVYFKGKWYWYSSTVEDLLAEYGRAEWDDIEELTDNSIEILAWMPLPEPYKDGE